MIIPVIDPAMIPALWFPKSALSGHPEGKPDCQSQDKAYPLSDGLSGAALIRMTRTIVFRISSAMMMTEKSRRISMNKSELPKR